MLTLRTHLKGKAQEIIPIIADEDFIDEAAISSLWSYHHVAISSCNEELLTAVVICIRGKACDKKIKNKLKARNILSIGVPIQGQETHIQSFVTH